MSREEIGQIIDLGLAKLDMAIEPSARTLIINLSQNLPFYAHSFGLYSGIKAVDNHRLQINVGDVGEATLDVLRNSHSVRSAYHKATYSTQKHSRYDVALLACALTTPDDLGFFSASAVREPMSSLLGEKVDVTRYAHYLTEFCDARRGKILQMVGEPRRRRYRFVDPLMQPFVLINVSFHKSRLGKQVCRE